MRSIQKIHLVGIGGSGMSGIAEVLHNLGYKVSGSDIEKNEITTRLSELGINIKYSHIPENVAECDVVVTSSAIHENNPEVVTARKRRIPIVPRAEMLAEIMRFKQGIAVAGTHGKTTTTSILATVLADAGIDPTFVIGGKLNRVGSNAKLGGGQYFIAEADESDASFLHLTPCISIITNIDRDHLGTYNNSFEQLKLTYLEFIHRIPFHGLAVLCGDDENIRQLLPNISRPYVTYGFKQYNDYQIINFQQHGLISKFSLQIPGENQPLNFNFNMPGRYNSLNAVATIIVALELDISPKQIQDSLLNFQGTSRRFDVIGNFSWHGKSITMIDDYGHHPTEIANTISAVREVWPQQRLVMVFQPHRYTRTKDLFDDFTTILSNVDCLLLLEVYSANEPVIDGADSRSLSVSIRSLGKVDPIYIKEDNLFDILNNIIQDGDVLLMQGAGIVSNIAHKLVKSIKNITLEKSVC